MSAHKSAGSRADPDPEWRDFSKGVVHVQAALAATPEQLMALFEALDRADERLDRERDTPRPAALDAINAIINFCAANPYTGNGRFSRVLELLATELRMREAARPKQTLPAPPGDKTGATNDIVTHHIQAAAALAVEWLHKTGVTVDTAAKEVAAQLETAGFPFAERRSEKWKAVRVWRNTFPAATPSEIKKRRTSAAKAYAQYVKQPPVTLTGDSEADRAAIRAWFSKLVARAAYRPVA